MPISPEQYRRYQRHLTLPEFGVAGQEKLMQASVLIVGAGGLGCPAALYLAAAGVGTIGIIDFDTVDESNLQRQVLYTTDDLGQPKAATAAQRLQRINPHITVHSHPVRLTRTNVLDIIPAYDLMIDGTDNFATRYLVNDACVLAGKINVYGSIYRFEGQATVFAAPGGPCYRCLFPNPPPPAVVPNCAQAGVLGILPGLIGTIQATETIKIIVGIGQPLIGRMLLFDALAMQWRRLRHERDRNCPVCGDDPSIIELQDYETLCGTYGGGDMTMEGVNAVREIGAAELKEVIEEQTDELVILDVRESYEFDYAAIAGAKLIPLGELPDRVNELTKFKDKLIVAHCHHGVRSAHAIQFLQTRGFKRVKNLAGGIDAWSRDVDSTVPRY